MPKGTFFTFITFGVSYSNKADQQFKENVSLLTEDMFWGVGSMAFDHELWV